MCKYSGCFRTLQLSDSLVGILQATMDLSLSSPSSPDDFLEDFLHMPHSPSEQSPVVTNDQLTVMDLSPVRNSLSNPSSSFDVHGIKHSSVHPRFEQHMWINHVHFSIITPLNTLLQDLSFSFFFLPSSPLLTLLLTDICTATAQVTLGPSELSRS